MKRQALLLCTLFALACGHSLAAASPDPAADNIGFMKNPPIKLRKQFPMCDAFLKVDWIDEKKNMGSATYDVYMNGSKIAKAFLAMVDLDPMHPRYDYDLQKYRNIGELNDMLSFIKRGKAFFPFSNLTIQVKDSRGGISEEEFTTVSDALAVDDNSQLSLANNRMTVCIPYPGSQRMYLAEYRRLNAVYAADQAAQRLRELSAWIPDSGFFRSAALVDTNFDGKEDYFDGVHIVYSHANRYYELRSSLDSSGNPVFSSPTNGKYCAPLPAYGYYLTTDGKRFFLNNRCNVTDLTK